MSKSAKFETITPDKAAKWLEECNTHNRKGNEARSDRYARYIGRGQWATTHQGIAFDESGVLLDGQNRLAAIIKAGKPVEMLVVRGLPRYMENGVKVDVQGLMDVGAGRTVGQQLSLDGVSYASLKSAAAKTIIAICCPSRMGCGVGVPESMEILKVFSDDMDAVISFSWKKNPMKLASVIGSLSFARRIAPDQIDWFSEKITTMANVPQRSQVLHLFNWFQSNPGHAQKGSGGRNELVSVVCDAIAKHIRGSSVRCRPSDEGIEVLCEHNRREVLAIRKMLNYQPS